MCRNMSRLSLAALILAGLPTCNKNGHPSQPGSSAPRPATLTVSSPSLKEGGPIIRQHTCDGADRSPALSWTAPPAGTKSFALIVDDPDAPSGTFTHWVLYELSPDRRELPEGLAPELGAKGMAFQGKNDFGKLGYGGPCPPAGKPHHYRFTVYALSAPTGLPPGASRKELEQAMQGRILAQGTLTSIYERAPGK